MKLRGAIIVGVILTISGLMVISPAIAAPNENAKSGPPELEKKVFIHYYKPNHQIDPDCDKKCESNDNNKTFLLALGGLKWPTLPIDFKINESQFSPLEITAIKNSADTWDDALDDVSGSSINLFNYQGTTTKTQDNVIDVLAPDLDNIIVRGDLDPDVIGVTVIWFDVNTKEVLDTSMVLNFIDFDWSTDPEGTPGKMDVQNIVTHELGHFLVLGDLLNPGTRALTMYGFSGTGEINARTLGAGDELGEVELYGTSDGGDDGDNGGPKSCEDFNPNHPRYCGP